MQQLSRRANSLAHLGSKSQSPFLVSSSLAPHPLPSPLSGPAARRHQPILAHSRPRYRVVLSGVRLGRRLKGARFPPASSRLGHALVH